MKIKSFLVAAVLLVSPLNAHAGTILQPAGASSLDTQFGDPTHAIDQSGLSAGYTSLVDDFDVYMASDVRHDSTYGTERWTGNAVPVSIDFDLGGSFLIESIAFWNQGIGGGSTRQFTLLASDNPGFTGAETIGEFNPLGLGSVDDVEGQVFSFSPIEASHIRLTATLSNGFPGATVGEVAFEVASVPEPTSMLLMVSGLAGLVGLRRRS